MRFFLDGLRTFGINADQWTTLAQDEGNSAEQGAERFMSKWTAEKVRAGLRHAAVLPEHDGKDQVEDSPKQACSCWFARHS